MPDDPLSRRERQIMDAVYCCGEASANQVLEMIEDPPSRTAIRTLLRIMVDKGHLSERFEGRQKVYQPIEPKTQAGKSAMKRVVETFFEGSLPRAVAAHLAEGAESLSEEEIASLEELIRTARAKGN